MKYILNRRLPLEGRARQFAALAKAAEIDTEGAYTTVAHWLCGGNPWGFHNDLRFSFPPSQVRQGVRIVEAAQRALDEDSEYIELSDDDYERLLSAVGTPERHVGEMAIPPELARVILPIVDALESAADEIST